MNKFTGSWLNDDILEFGKDLLPGIYFMQVTGGSNSDTYKIIKK